MLIASSYSVDATSPVFTRAVRALLVPVTAVLILWKIPGILQGRLWAEDGLFLLDALHLPWWQALTTPHTGYIDIVASGAMLVATGAADLEHAALVSVGIALLIQICPVILLVTSRCDWLRPPWVLAIAVLLVVTPPVAEEVWLSPVTSQYHVMVCTGLILSLEVGTGATGVFQLVLLGIAGLTGPGPALVAPLFVARALLDRSSSRAVQAATLCAGVLIEIAVFCAHPVPARNLGISPLFLLRVIYMKHLLIAFLGPKLAFSVASGMGRAWLLGRDASMAMVGPLVAIGSLAVAAATARAREVPWLFASGLMMMVLSYFGALGQQAQLLEIYFGGRYYFAPQVLIALTLLGVARTGTRIPRTLAVVLVCWLLAVGIKTYRVVNPDMAQGPSWQEQVALWRMQKDRPVALWPRHFQIVP